MDAKGEPLANPGRLIVDTAVLRSNYDKQPFALQHNLHTLPMFQPPALDALAKLFDACPADYFVAASAAQPGQEFFAVPGRKYSPSEALSRLDSEPLRLLLKRPENHDRQFRRLLQDLFEQVTATVGGLQRRRVVRIESAVFITSAASITPFHFDPETNFFAQISGRKTYHVYPPAVLPEAKLEKFYLQGLVSIGQVDIPQDVEREVVVSMGPGDGLHQPQNAPHWVQTEAGRSVSYAFVYETAASRSVGRARACNYYVRKLGIQPAPVGAHPLVDHVKSDLMRGLIPLRNGVRNAIRSVRHD